MVFTTNAPHRLSKRFRDRCESHFFRSETAQLAPAIRRLAQHVWKAEVGRGKPPMLDKLGMPTLEGLEQMHASFRLMMVQLQQLIREAKAEGRNLNRAIQQVKKNLVVATAAGHSVTCDHCSHEQDAVVGLDNQTCEECGSTFALEY